MADKEIEDKLKKKFISRLVKSNKKFGRKLAWLPDGTVLETVASRFYYLCKGEVNELLAENKRLRTSLDTVGKAFDDINIILTRTKTDDEKQT